MDEIEYGPPILNTIIIHSIPSALVQQVSFRKAGSPLKVTEVFIPSPLIQHVIMLKVGTPHKVSEVRIPSLPVQQVVMLLVGSRLKVTEDSIPTVLVQKVRSLRITPLTRITTSLVIACPKVTSEFSFFWDPKAEDSKEVASNSITEVAELPVLVLNHVFVSQIPKVLIQEVSLLLTFILNQVTVSPITTAPIQSITTLCAVPLDLIVVTSITKPPMDLVFCSFTLEKVLTSLQNTSSPSAQSSPFSFKKNLQYSIQKIKVVPLPKKMQFSGHLRYQKLTQWVYPKVCLSGTGWKRMRKK